MMDASVISFYVISAFLLTFGLMAVTAKKIFRSAIWLLFSLVGIASLYFWMDLQFLAAVQIIVYIGGIVVLIIFSIFLTQDSGSALPRAIKSRKIGAALLSVFGFGIIATLLARTAFVETTTPMDVEMKTIGFKMLSLGGDGYALPFELVSILLLAAMIGCIVIAVKNIPGKP
ncbi:MAG: NADH-quinone oxidoreductase subunit J [Bacteroidetes bacterium]|nr:NADH-quinone oxidoreductase subunit J [Bacteroidota bacterium]MBK7429545.1 NADH-quinone oxidoreductase subunit J [Bacteroidota bacterium]